MAWAKKYQIYRKKCLHCGEMFACYRKVNNYCNPGCALRGRGPEWFKEQQRKMTAARLKIGWTKRIQRLRALGFTDPQIRIVMKERETARSTGFQTGKRKGWAEACGESHGLEKTR